MQLNNMVSVGGLRVAGYLGCFFDYLGSFFPQIMR